jgi:uncharacterized protein (TIGR02300 family)
MAAAAVSEPRGLKRICPSCGTRYYDLNKRPIICPSCTTEFKSEIKTKGRRSRLAAANDELAKAKPAAKIIADDADVAVADGDEEIVSLTEVEELEEEEEDEDLALDPDLALDDDAEAVDDEGEEELEEIAEDDDKA